MVLNDIPTGFRIAAYQHAIYQRHSTNGKRLRMQDALALQADSHDFIWQEQSRALPSTLLTGGSVWASVADGVSSSPCAALASLSFLEVLHHVVEEAALKGLPETLPQRVRTAVQEWQFRYRNERTEGASTTLASIHIVHDQVCAVNCGDSRVWRLRRQRSGEIEWLQLSLDHTVWQQILQEELEPEEAGMEHASIYDGLLHCLTLGESTDPEPIWDAGLTQHTGASEEWLHVWRGRVAQGDVYLLATDGLHGTVGDARLSTLWRGEASLDENISHLKQAYLYAGRLDDCSMIAIEIIGPLSASCGC